MTAIRPFGEDDKACLEGLLDADPDPLWRGQGHLMHGAERDGPQWRRTVIAEHGGRIVGAATVARNAVHPGRYNAAVEVMPEMRRRGIGQQLAAALRALRLDSLPMSGKIREHDQAGRGLLAACGGRAYQRCPCPTFRLDEPAIRAWCSERGTDPAIRPFLDPDAMIAPFVSLYQWQHERWSPVGDAAQLLDIARRICTDADPTLSRVATVGGTPVAIALAFRDGDHADIVTETVDRDTPDGEPVLVATIAALLDAATLAGVTRAEFDGHDDDPHLAPVLATMPPASTNPLLLVEVP